ncbi:hypothetical protein [Oceanirhabdus seepicola]|uniref:DNA-binding protein n=1 Tax=Oceanirhabdus seepicola TaxID=2828781 RepID=A0A9J6P890_9CLOT|nr:hypothetical protein [Oceanirhabdus seepicola]MCM1992795.1 hypothetical protein [Oceanirhabdus seepicola]
MSVLDEAKLLDTDRSNIYRWDKGEMVVSRDSFEKIRGKLSFKRTKEL